jgi:hypothetical protein
MPTIELTDEQAEELREVLLYEIDALNVEIENVGDPDDADSMGYAHSRSVLSDILHLLEIA